MATHQIAKGIAQLGRHGDTTLVHMQPEEVAGLQALAKSQGTSLTINPHTGLPEAFSLGGFFSSLLPTIAGFGASMIPGLQPMGLSAMQAGILAGAATGALTSKDPLTGALMGGLGGYGGAGLGKAAAGFTASNAGMNVADPLIQDQIKQQMASNAMGNVGAAGNTALGTPGFNMAPLNASGPGIKLAGGALPGYATDASLAFNPSIAPVGGNLASTARAAAPTFGSNLQQAYSNVAANPLEFIGQNKMAVGMPLAGAVLGGIEPSDIYGDPIPKSDKDKYDPYATLNLGGDSGLRLLAAGGPVSFDNGGYVSSDMMTPPQLSQDGYGLGRLNAMSQGGMPSYAEGGETSLNLDEIPSLNLGTGTSRSMGMGGDAMYSFSPNNPLAGVFKQILAKMPQSDRASFLADPGMRAWTGIQERPKQEYYNASGNLVSSYAKGGYLDGPGDGMSDSIPATIEGKQPARLADGEFVVPADVVSHLGNGSTKAGSQRLYGMLDKVRKARTGTKKQGKQINPAKYMPA